MLKLLTIIQQHRLVIGNFIARDLKVKYRGTLFGYLWSLLEPLSLVLVYYFVFGIIARRGGQGYPLVVAVGVFTYNFMGAVVQGGTSALVANAGLIRRVYLPREIFVLSNVGSNVVMFALNMLAVIPFMIYYEVTPSGQLVYLPVAAFFMTLFSSGLAFIAACANALFRDVGYVVRVSLRLFFYGAPTIYPVSMVPESVRDLYLLNPVALYISWARSAVMNSPIMFESHHLAVAIVSALLSFVVGTWLFQRWEKQAVKFL